MKNILGLFSIVAGCLMPFGLIAGLAVKSRCAVPANVPSAEEQRIIAAGTSTLGTLLPEGLLLKVSEDRSLTLDNVITFNSAPSPAWLIVRDAKNENWQDPETCYIELRGVEPEVLHRGDGTTVIHFKKKKKK